MPAIKLALLRVYALTALALCTVGLVLMSTNSAGLAYWLGLGLVLLGAMLAMALGVRTALAGRAKRRATLGQ
jgi:hypothetical protein